MAPFVDTRNWKHASRPTLGCKGLLWLLRRQATAMSSRQPTSNRCCDGDEEKLCGTSCPRANQVIL